MTLLTFLGNILISHLKLTEKPVFAGQITPYKKYIYKCQAHGSPRPQIKWTFNDGPLCVFFDEFAAQNHSVVGRIAESTLGKEKAMS